MDAGYRTSLYYGAGFGGGYRSAWLCYDLICKISYYIYRPNFNYGFGYGYGYRFGGGFVADSDTKKQEVNPARLMSAGFFCIYSFSALYELAYMLCVLGYINLLLQRHS